MRRCLHRSSKRTIRKRGLPIVSFELDWLYFGGGAPHGRWKWGNPRRLWGKKTRQEIRALEADDQQ